MALPVIGLNPKLEGEMEFRGKKYSVPFALPGDLVQFRLLRKGRKSKFQVVHIEKTEESGKSMPLSEDPGCRHFGRCGGCRARHLDYSFQFDWKAEPIVKSMSKDYGLEVEKLPAPRLAGFRNRMDYAVEGSAIGLRPPQDFETVLPLEQCPVLREPGESILLLFRGLLEKHPGIGWNRKDAVGWLKYVTIRVGKNVAIVLTTAGQRNKEIESFLRELENAIAEEEQNTGITFNLIETTTEAGNEVSCGPGGVALRGEPGYVDELGGSQFDVAYDSFFQPNPMAFSLLLDAILTRLLHRLESSGDDLPRSVTDLYCGGGVLSWVLCKRTEPGVEKVLGYEFVESAVVRAQDLFARSSISAEFKTIDLNRPGSLPMQSDLLIADPPRAGLSPDLCKEIMQKKPSPWFLYISCNPDTQLRDLQMLGESYKPMDAVLADCFPYTGHLEQAVLLRRIH